MNYIFLLVAQISQGQYNFIKCAFSDALNFFGFPILIIHLLPIGNDYACKYVRIELAILQLAKMLRQFFAWQCLGFSVTAFIPTYPPALDTFSFVDPCFPHDTYCIVKIGVRFKPEIRLRNSKSVSLWRHALIIKSCLLRNRMYHMCL